MKQNNPLFFLFVFESIRCMEIFIHSQNMSTWYQWFTDHWQLTSWISLHMHVCFTLIFPEFPPPIIGTWLTQSRIYKIRKQRKYHNVQAVWKAFTFCSTLKFKPAWSPEMAICNSVPVASLRLICFGLSVEKLKPKMIRKEQSRVF